MNYRNPLQAIHSALAHVTHVLPKTIDWWPKNSILLSHLDVHCFGQAWGDTSCGHGGMAGQAVTTGDVVVVQTELGRHAAVYSAGRLLYAVRRPNEKFYADLARKSMRSHGAAKVYEQR